MALRHRCNISHTGSLALQPVGRPNAPESAPGNFFYAEIFSVHIFVVDRNRGAMHTNGERSSHCRVRRINSPGRKAPRFFYPSLVCRTKAMYTPKRSTQAHPGVGERARSRRTQEQSLPEGGTRMKQHMDTDNHRFTLEDSN